MKEELFITCQENLELLLEEELHELGFLETRIGYSGVFVPFSMEAVYKINYCSRLASRVLYPLASIVCFHKGMLYEAVKRLPLDRYLKLNKTFAIDVTGKHSGFKNTIFAAQIVKDAICDYFRDKTGERPSVNVKTPDIQLHLFLEKGKATLSIDTSLDPLFKRGYRKESVTAPMQESLAAALLRLARYEKGQVLLDPTCGSGTLLIEAAMMATRTPPGFYRTRFGFFEMPTYSKEAWQKIKEEANSLRTPLLKGQIFGFDKNKAACFSARVNARVAGFFDEITVEEGDFQEIGTLEKEPDIVICNPPHGERLGSVHELIPLYRALGDFFKHKVKKGGRAYLFTRDLTLAKEVGLKPLKRHLLMSSGKEARLLEFEVY